MKLFPARRSDLLGAAAVTGLTLALVVLAALSSPTATDSALDKLVSWWTVLAVLVVQGIALVGSRVSPARVLVVVAALPLCTLLLDVTEISTVTIVPIMVAAYLAGTRTSGVPLRISISASALSILATTTVGSARAAPWPVALLSAVVVLLIVLGLPLLTASIVVARRRMMSALRAETEALERMQGALLDAAIAQERTAIARELHDIAAHHMAGIALMCAAGERQIDTDPEAVKAALIQIRARSRLVLGDLRQAVGLLRGGTEPGIEVLRVDAIQDLIDSQAADGEQVHLHVNTLDDDTTIVEGLGPLAHLAGYRMVQESLANAARHAPGAWRKIQIDDTASAGLRIVVTNGPASRGSDSPQRGGFGLRGMFERTELVGGTLHYGHTAEGGWQVSLTIPRIEEREAEGTT